MSIHFNTNFVQFRINFVRFNSNFQFDLFWWRSCYHPFSNAYKTKGFFLAWLLVSGTIACMSDTMTESFPPSDVEMWLKEAILSRLESLKKRVENGVISPAGASEMYREIYEAVQVAEMRVVKDGIYRYAFHRQSPRRMNTHLW